MMDTLTMIASKTFHLIDGSFAEVFVSVLPHRVQFVSDVWRADLFEAILNQSIGGAVTQDGTGQVAQLVELFDEGRPVVSAHCDVQYG